MIPRTKKIGELLYWYVRKKPNIVYGILNSRGGYLKDLAEKLNTKPLTILIIVGELKRAGIIKEVRIK